MLTAKSLSEQKKKAPKTIRNKKKFRRSLKTNLRSKRESLNLSVFACAEQTKIARVRYDMLEAGIEPYVTEVEVLMAFFDCEKCSELWPDIRLGY